MPITYNKILVPVDGSPHALLACRHAIALSKCSNATLVLLHCFGETSAPISGETKEKNLREYEVHAKTILAPCEALCTEQNVTYKALMRSGAPAQVIVHMCKEEQCDIIVMGSRGFSDFSGIAMGSCSNRVLKHSPVSVLIAR